MSRLTFKNGGCVELLACQRDFTCADTCNSRDDEGCQNCPIAAAFDKLYAYEETGLSPEIVMQYKIFEDEAISLGTSFIRILELMKADANGQVVIKAPPLEGTCGTCKHFVRTPGKASGYCDCRNLLTRYGKDTGKTLCVTQSRKRCRDNYEEKES